MLKQIRRFFNSQELNKAKRFYNKIAFSKHAVFGLHVFQNLTHMDGLLKQLDLPYAALCPEPTGSNNPSDVVFDRLLTALNRDMDTALIEGDTLSRTNRFFSYKYALEVVAVAKTLSGRPVANGVYLSSCLSAVVEAPRGNSRLPIARMQKILGGRNAPD